MRFVSKPENRSFPKGAPNGPGIYRFGLRGADGDFAVYIGEAALLNRRFAHYRSPGKTQETNKWVNAAMMQILCRRSGLR